jgi:hypothetical protein
VFLSLSYLMLRRVLQLAVLRVRSSEFKELEILVLRHELAILRRRTRRPTLSRIDRLFLAAASRLLPSPQWQSFIITPQPCFAGIGAWSRHVGRIRVAPVAHLSAVRSDGWSCASRERTRDGATSASSAN